jgi:hypothetical protein
MLGLACANAQDIPPRELLDKIIPQLQQPLTPAKFSFRALPGAVDDICGMQNFEMVLQREDNKEPPNKYSVWLNPQSDGAHVIPRQILALISRLAVDADGSERAYHPEDPYGTGVCERRAGLGGQPVLKGVCALDTFNSSGIRVFLETQRARLIDANKSPRETTPSLADSWTAVWPLIRGRSLKSYDLKSVAADAPSGYNLFYWKKRKLTALTKRAIIPSTHDGYPCIRGEESRYPGYFVTATTLTRPSVARPDGCAPERYIDAATIPFFVLPGGNFGQIEIGDIVIGYFKSGSIERVAFGIAADAGPIEQFGEGSVAFNQILLGKTAQFVMNVRDVYALDIDSELLKRENATLSILLLGSTKKQLKGNYSRENIEKIGREELTHWNGSDKGLTQRLNACIARAKVQ